MPTPVAVAAVGVLRPTGQTTWSAHAQKRVHWVARRSGQPGDWMRLVTVTNHRSSSGPSRAVVASEPMRRSRCSRAQNARRCDQGR